MSARNVLRRWTSALKTGEKIDLISGESLKVLPASDDVGKVQFGDGTNDFDVEVYLGDTTKKVTFDVGASQVTLGTGVSLDVPAGGLEIATVAINATAAEINSGVDLSAQAIATTAGAGITGGAGTLYKHSLTYEGNLKVLRILLDITDLASSTTDLDIIGQGASAAHLGRIVAAEVGTVLAVEMTCLELPAGGVTDIDLYSATVATGVYDDGIAALTETAIITAGGVWTNGAVKGATTVPPANDYLYLCGGAAGVPGTYTAGKFLIEVYGY